MQRLLKDRLKETIEYLGKDIANCIYMYIDLKEYGLDNPNLIAWIDTDENGICAVATKYYDSIWFYTHKPSDPDMARKAATLFTEQDVTMFSGQKEVMVSVYQQSGCDKTHTIETGWVMKHPDKRRSVPEDTGFTVETAKPEDSYEIAKLMCIDNGFNNNYNVDILAEQLRDRMLTGLGCSWVVRDNDKLIGHTAIFAKTDDAAVASGLIVHPDYRNTGCFELLWQYAIEELKDAGLQGYGFVSNVKKNIVKLDAIIGMTSLSEYAKITRIK